MYITLVCLDLDSTYGQQLEYFHEAYIVRVLSSFFSLRRFVHQ